VAREIEGSHLALAGENAPKPASPTQASGYHPRAAQPLGDKQQLAIGNRHLAKYQLLIANCYVLLVPRFVVTPAQSAWENHLMSLNLYYNHSGVADDHDSPRRDRLTWKKRFW
jgi:hypothetical protein